MLCSAAPGTAVSNRLSSDLLSLLRRRRLRRLLVGVMDTQIVLRGLVPLPRRPDEPLHRLLIVLGHPTARLVAQTEIALRRRALLLRRTKIPFHRFLIILRHHVTLFVIH